MDLRAISTRSFMLSMAARAGMLVHDSAGVPPQDEWIRPMGTSSFLARSRAKKYATAENPPTVLGPHACQPLLAIRSSTGLPATLSSTVNRRILGFSLPAISSAALRTP